MDQRVYLKVKIKSLAEEARIIRKEEKKGGPWRTGLYHHRIGEVRIEARATLLAYAFIRGRSYERTESRCTYPFFYKDKVRSMVKRYGIQRDWINDESHDAWSVRKEDEAKRLEAWLINIK